MICMEAIHIWYYIGYAEVINGVGTKHARYFV